MQLMCNKPNSDAREMTPRARFQVFNHSQVYNPYHRNLDADSLAAYSGLGA